MTNQVEYLVECKSRGDVPTFQGLRIVVPAGHHGRSTARSERSVHRFHSNNCSFGHPLYIGRSSAPCGLSIWSAYANGIGACLAIDERIGVSALVGDALNAKSLPRTEVGKYVNACVDHAAETAGQPLLSHVRLQISSGVPSGKGIKTSSALGASLTSAIFSAMNVNAGPATIVQSASDAARTGGVTQVGSIDDVWAAVNGGIVVTNGSTRELMAHWPAPDSVEVVILIPHGESPAVHRRDRRALMVPHRASFDRMVKRMLSTSAPISEMYSTMTEAAYITARAFEYPVEPLTIALRHGALGVSLSGKGPAIGAITTDRRDTERVIDAWRQYPGQIIRTRPDNSGLKKKRTGGNEYASFGS